VGGLLWIGLAARSPASNPGPQESSRAVIRGSGTSRPLVTDPSNTSFSVVVTTTVAVTGTVIYGTSPGAMILTATDNRDVASVRGSPPAHTVSSAVHRFTLTGLVRATTYYYEPILAGVRWTDSTGQPFHGRTANLSPGGLPPLPTVVYGRVAAASGSTPVGAVLLVLNTIQADRGAPAAPQSVLLTHATGRSTSYVFPSGGPPLITSPGTGYFVPTAGTSFTVEAFADVPAGLGHGGPVAATPARATGLVAEPPITLSSIERPAR
jgi:hypothetical protein